MESHSPRFEAFFVALRELGYVHGRNIAIEFLSANANNDRFPELIAECLRLKPDIIAVTTTPAARLSKNATRDIPVVMVALGAILIADYWGDQHVTWGFSTKTGVALELLVRLLAALFVGTHAMATWGWHDRFWGRVKRAKAS